MRYKKTGMPNWFAELFTNPDGYKNFTEISPSGYHFSKGERLVTRLLDQMRTLRGNDSHEGEEHLSPSGGKCTAVEHSHPGFLCDLEIIRRLSGYRVLVRRRFPGGFSRFQSFRRCAIKVFPAVGHACPGVGSVGRLEQWYPAWFF